MSPIVLIFLISLLLGFSSSQSSRYPDICIYFIFSRVYYVSYFTTHSKTNDKKKSGVNFSGSDCIFIIQEIQCNKDSSTLPSSTFRNCCSENLELLCQNPTYYVLRNLTCDNHSINVQIVFKDSKYLVLILFGHIKSSI